MATVTLQTRPCPLLAKAGCSGQLCSRIRLLPACPDASAPSNCRAILGLAPGSTSSNHTRPWSPLLVCVSGAHAPNVPSQQQPTHALFTCYCHNMPEPLSWPYEKARRLLQAAQCLAHGESPCGPLGWLAGPHDLSSCPAARPRGARGGCSLVSLLGPFKITKRFCYPLPLDNERLALPTPAAAETKEIPGSSAGAGLEPTEVQPAKAPPAKGFAC